MMEAKVAIRCHIIVSDVAAAWASGGEEDAGSELADALGLGYASDDASDMEAPQQQKPNLDTGNAVPAGTPDRAAEADRSDEAKADTPTEVAQEGGEILKELESENNLQLDESAQHASPAAERAAAEEVAAAVSSDAEEAPAVSVEEPAARASARVDDSAQKANGAAASFCKGDRLGCTAHMQMPCLQSESQYFCHDAVSCAGARLSQSGSVIHSVWYVDREGTRRAALVLSVDVMHPPPSYCIRLDGADSTRETEGHRLELRAVADAPGVQPGSTTSQQCPALDQCFVFRPKSALRCVMHEPKDVRDGICV